MADTKKTILAVIGAIGLIVIIVVVAAIGGMVYFVRSHVNAQQASVESANEEITRTRARFAGQHPMIEQRTGASAADDDERFIVHHPDPAAPRATLQSLRALAYDHRRERLLHVSVPFWLLRLAPSGNAAFNFPNDSEVDIHRFNLTVEDLERHGPGLVLDTHDRRGADVLVWVE